MKYLVFLAGLMAGVPLMALIARANRRGRSLVLALLVLSPAFGPVAKLNFCSMEAYRGPDRGFEVTLTDLTAMGLALTLLLRPGRLTWFPPAALALASYFALCVISAGLSPEPLYSSFTVFKLMRCALVYWVFVNAVRSREDVRAVITGWTAAGLLVAALAFVQKYLFHVWRVYGPFDHSNTVSVYVNVMLAPVLMSALVDPELTPAARLAGLASVLGMLFAQLSTFSRAGIVLCSGSFALTLALALVRRPSRRAGLVAALALVVAVAGVVKALPRVADRFEHAAEESLEAREEFNAAAMAMIADHPEGIGVNAFSQEMALSQYGAHVRVMANESPPGVAHNIYLLTAAELGVCGLAVFMYLMARFQWMAVRTAIGRAGPESMLAAAVALGMICTHLSGMLEWVFRITAIHYQFIFSAGLAVALHRLRFTR